MVLLCDVTSGEFCLIHLLEQRHPGMFYQHFVECIFHFNSYDKHKGSDSEMADTCDVMPYQLKL